ncbi:integrator complex subunit 2-like [Octopus vulgaris]|uniref:Integrator complex subunit 2-like n=1 Tax=Octopus vulgaris TaxID=6645 RepID=A0AA36AYF0_OCTVU|nr:integrator complex subunit 2-like [Octopus vulgaris]
MDIPKAVTMDSPSSPVDPDIFQAMQNVDVNCLSRMSESKLRPVLPALVRMALCKSVDTSEAWATSRKTVLNILSNFDVVNGLVALLSIDFHSLEQDVKKEQNLREKIGSNQSESALISQLEQGLSLEFERSDCAHRIRLVLSEIFFIIGQIKESKDFYVKSSELFECEIYLEDISDVLCIAQAELPSLLPIVSLANALLSVKNGSWLLCRLVANSPDCFHEVCKHLVSHGDKVDEDSIAGQRRMTTLQILCAMNPSETLTVRSLCVQHCAMPGLTISLSLSMIRGKNHHKNGPASDIGNNDLLPFITGLLLGPDQNVRTWFSQYIKSGQKKKKGKMVLLISLRETLLELLQEILPKPHEAIANNQVIKASSFIRLYCALKGMAAFKFTEQEMKLILDLITSQPPLTAAGARFVSLGLCFLISSPYFMTTSEQEGQVTEWIRWLMKFGDSFEKETGGTSFEELLFLIAIHFHSNQTYAIADLVSATLGMKSPVKSNSLTKLRYIFTQEIFTEQVITMHAVKVPVTPQLNANMTGYLPVHSIYQLLKSYSFAKHKVPIKDWIYKQMLNSSVPLHTKLPLLIEVYVNSILVKGNKSDFQNEPIGEQEVLDVFKESVFTVRSNCMVETSKPNQKTSEEQPCLTPQLLMLYYMLLYEDSLLNNMRSIVSCNRKIKVYPEYVMEEIPINFLIQEAQKNQHFYAGLFSPLLRLLATHYPHLCLVEDWLEESVAPVGLLPSLGASSKNVCTPEAFQKAVDDVAKKQQCPLAIFQLLDSLLLIPARDLLVYADCVVAALPSILNASVPRRVQDLIKKIWFRLHGLMPRRLRLMTVNALRINHNGVKSAVPVSENDITVDPLVVLQCDNRVFRCPPVLEIVLRVLEAYIQACRVFLSSHIASHPLFENPGFNNAQDQDKKDKEKLLDKTSVSLEQERKELKNALTSAQESAVVQILLECCLRQPDEMKETSLLSNLREVQCLICSFLHQMYIADPNLAKLVHFQGYPSELLPITVAGIPSMHICFDFIPELLSQPQMEKQMFAIELASHLCLQYALPKAMNIARVIINIMFTVLGAFSAHERAEFLIKTVPSLLLICQAFPPLCEDVTSLLMQIGRVCIATLSSTSNVMQTAFINNKDSFDHSDANIRKVTTFVKGTLSGQYFKLNQIVRATFSEIVQKAVVMRNIY